jgi:hypothetical protein
MQRAHVSRVLHVQPDELIDEVSLVTVDREGAIQSLQDSDNCITRISVTFYVIT